MSAVYSIFTVTLQNVGQHVYCLQYIQCKNTECRSACLLSTVYSLLHYRMQVSLSAVYSIFTVTLHNVGQHVCCPQYIHCNTTECRSACLLSSVYSLKNYRMYVSLSAVYSIFTVTIKNVDQHVCCLQYIHCNNTESRSARLLSRFTVTIQNVGQLVCCLQYIHCNTTECRSACLLSTVYSL